MPPAQTQRPRGHAQKPQRDVPSKKISPNLPDAGGRDYIRRVFVILLELVEIEIFANTPFANAPFVNGNKD